MDLRLFTAAVVACLFILAGLAVGQTPPAADRAVGDPARSEDIDRIRQRERTGSDANTATGSFGATGRGSASGAADSAPAEGRRSPGGHETMSEPSGPGSAERRPGTAVGQ
jgi:hypothetical protein